MPPKKDPTRPQGLYARQSDKPVTTRSGRTVRHTTFTQDPDPRAEYLSDVDEGVDHDGPYVEEDEYEFVEAGEEDPFADPVPRDTEGYSLTYAGERDLEGRDANGYTRAQNAVWESSQLNALTYGYDAEGYDINGRDPDGFTREENERFRHSQVHRFNAEGYDAQGFDVEGRSKAENTEISKRVFEEAAARNPPHQQARTSPLRLPNPRNTPALRSRDAVPRSTRTPTQRQLFGPDSTGSRDLGVPPTAILRPRNVDLGGSAIEATALAFEATAIRSRLHASVENAHECDRQARAIRERLSLPGIRGDSSPRHNALVSRLRDYEEQLVAADATTGRLSAQLRALTESGDLHLLRSTAARHKRSHEDDVGHEGTGRGNVDRLPTAGRLAAWAGTDPTGTAQRLLERHYRPHRDDEVLSVSSDDSKGSQARKTRTLPPVPESVSPYLHRYTQAPQQKAMHAKANAPFMEVAAICRSANGMRYGAHAQHDEVVRYLCSPETFTAGVPQLRDRTLSLINAEPKLYSRIRHHASRMISDDPTTWDFPYEEIEQLHRFYSDMLTCFVVHQRRMNAGENPPLTIALVYSVFTTNPINWATLAKSHDPLKTNTWLFERTGQDIWRAFDAWTPEVVAPRADARPPGGRGGGGGGGARTRNERREERRDDRRERSPPPAKPVATVPLTPVTPPGINNDASRTASRPPLAPGQCANCLALNAGHNGKDCPQPCRKGGCRDAAVHPRNTCAK